MKKDFCYLPEMKMADLIHHDYRLLMLLSRFSIELGFGDQSIASICKKHDISPEFFILICHIYSFDHYTPSLKEIEAIDVVQLIQYLKKSHRYYLDHRLEQISEEILQVIADSEKSHADILSRFFDEYKKEVLHHFRYEEDVVFPYISNMVQGNRSKEYNIDIFEENHTNIEEKLNDLKNILIKYLPDHSSSGKRVNLLFHLFDFEVDLTKHTLLEDLILIPKVHLMEEYYGCR